MLKITHLSHAGFAIENDKEKLIIDPADASFGYEFKDEVANYLLVSHDHWDHNNISGIAVEENVGSFRITKIDSFHDKTNGSERGENIIHIIETDGIRICHLGDLGHVLTEDQIKQIGRVDILIIPTGGVFTIDSKEAIEVIGQLNNPETIIPMHYKTEKWGEDKGIDSVDKFIEKIKGYKIEKPDSNVLDYEKPSEKTVYII